MIRYIEMFIMYICFWLCGAVFSHTMERRKNFKRNATATSILFLTLFIAMCLIFPSQMFLRKVIAKNLCIILMLNGHQFHDLNADDLTNIPQEHL